MLQCLSVLQSAGEFVIHPQGVRQSLINLEAILLKLSQLSVRACAENPWVTAVEEEKQDPNDEAPDDYKTFCKQKDKRLAPGTIGRVNCYAIVKPYSPNFCRILGLDSFYVSYF